MEANEQAGGSTVRPLAALAVRGLRFSYSQGDVILNGVNFAADMDRFILNVNFIQKPVQGGIYFFSA